MRTIHRARQQADDVTALRQVPDRGVRPLIRVLVAASDPDLRLYVRLGLTGMAGQVLEAGDGLEALQRLGGRRVDLVVADARMPRLDGLELARVLAGREVPLLLLASRAADLPHESGVSAVLVKPFDRRQLRRGVGEALAAADGGSRWREEVR